MNGFLKFLFFGVLTVAACIGHCDETVALGSINIDSRISVRHLEVHAFSTVEVGTTRLGGLVLGNTRVSQRLSLGDIYAIAASRVRVGNFRALGVTRSINARMSARVGRIVSIGGGNVSLANVTAVTPAGGRTSTGVYLGSVGSTLFYPVRVGNASR